MFARLPFRSLHRTGQPTTCSDKSRLFRSSRRRRRTLIVSSARQTYPFLHSRPASFHEPPMKKPI